MPKEIVDYQSFPGSRLAVWRVGDLTAEKFETIRQADAIVVEEVKSSGVEERFAAAMEFE